MSHEPLRVVTLSADELDVLVRTACREAVLEASRAAASSIDRVSASRAAQIVNRRRALVIQALRTGALPAQRSGRDWKIAVGDVDRWASAGCPAELASAPASMPIRVHL